MTETPHRPPPSITPLLPPPSSGSSVALPSLVFPPSFSATPSTSAAHRSYNSKTPPTLPPSELHLPEDRTSQIHVPQASAPVAKLQLASETADIVMASDSLTNGVLPLVSVTDDAPIHSVQDKEVEDQGFSLVIPSPRPALSPPMDPHVNMESLDADSSDTVHRALEMPQISVPPDTGAPPPAGVPLSVPTEDVTRHGMVGNDSEGCVEQDCGLEVRPKDRDSSVSIHGVRAEVASTSIAGEPLETVQPNIQVPTDNEASVPSESVNADEGTPHCIPPIIQSPGAMVNDACESTPADSQRTEDEDDVMRALLPETPASIPSLLLPSMSASRSSSVEPQEDIMAGPAQNVPEKVPSVLLSNALASDKVQLPDSWRADWLEVLNNWPSSAVSALNVPLPEGLETLSPLSSELLSPEVPDDVPPNHRTANTCGHPDMQTRDIDSNGHYSKPSYCSYSATRAIASCSGAASLEGCHTQYPPGSQRGGPSASLSELTQLARRERNSTSVPNSEPSRERKRKRDAASAVREGYQIDVGPVIHPPNALRERENTAEANACVDLGAPRAVAGTSFAEGEGPIITSVVRFFVLHAVETSLAC